MGQVTKPLQVNPTKLSQPMGSVIAFLGVRNCMPIMHGAQGCASFTKVFFTRHFNEPIAMQNTAVRDITAILDGGDFGITTAVDVVVDSVHPSLVGVCSTGLTETKGDDLRGATAAVEYPTVYVNTPDYEGGLESGWALTTKALIEQLVEETTAIEKKKITIIPNVNLEPIEVEKIKEFLEILGFSVFALPDISDSLDGHLGNAQTKLSDGGIDVEDIKTLANSEIVITIGRSVKVCGESFKKKNPSINLIELSHLYGLEATDKLVENLTKVDNFEIPSSVKRWRKRLQDALLDSHFVLGSSKGVMAGEPDLCLGLKDALSEAGFSFSEIFLTTGKNLESNHIRVGDLEDLEESLDESIEVILTNFHGMRLANRYGKVLVTRGFPNYEEVGNQLKNNVLYEGGCNLLFEVANKIIHKHESHHV